MARGAGGEGDTLDARKISTIVDCQSRVGQLCAAANGRLPAWQGQAS